MDASEIKVGTKLEFEIINSIGSKIGQSYKSELIRIESSTEIIISCPVNETRLMFISADTNIRITFLHEQEGVISFTAVIIGKEKSENHVFLHIKTGNDFKEIQRRNYFRPECNLKAKYRLSNENNRDDTDLEDKYINAITQNISSCGACILIDENIPIHTLLDLIIWLSEKRSIKMKCRVMRNCEHMYGTNKKYELGLYMEDMTQLDHNTLLKYINDSVTVKERLLHWNDRSTLE